MPFDTVSAKKHNKSLGKNQAKQWAKIANSARRTCLAENKSEKVCDARAIRIANGVIKKQSKRKT